MEKNIKITDNVIADKTSNGEKKTYLDYESKLQNHIERVMHLKEFGFSYPAHFTLGLVTYCDQFCKGCYAGGYRFDPKIMNTASLETYKRVLRTAANFGSEYEDQNHEFYSKETLGLKSVSLVGSGEPALYPYLPELVKFMDEELNLDIGMYTNGFTIRDNVIRPGIDREPQNIATLVMDHFKFVRFSLDAASQDTHLKERGVRDQFPTIIENIKQLVKRKKELGKGPTIGVQFTIDDNNVHEINDMAKLAKELGVDYLAYKPKYVPWYIRKEKMTNLMFEDVERQLDEAIKYATDDFKIHGKFQQIKLAWGPDRCNTGEHYSKCTDVWMSSYLDLDIRSATPKKSDLRVFICVNKDKEEVDENGDLIWSVGPVNEDTDFDNFWKKKMPEMINKVKVKECVAGCKNDPYNRLVDKLVDKDSGDLVQIQKNKPEMPDDSHINHI